MTTTTIASPIDDRLLTLVAAGVRRPGEILIRSGYSETVLRAVLHRLTVGGFLDRGLFGGYGLTAVGRQRVIDRALATVESGADPDMLNPRITALDQMWRHRVATRLLPGSRITAALDDGHLRTGELVLDPTRHVIGDVREARRRVAAALERPAEQVIIEDHPTQVGNRGRLVLVDEHSPLYGVLDHPGSAAFDPATTTVTIGLYADGAPVLWPLRDGFGAVNSVVAGDATAGTSTVLRGVLGAVAGSDGVDTLAVDVGGCGGLGTAGTVTAETHSDATEVLHNLLDAMHEPAPDTSAGRLLVLALGDLHRLLADPTLRRLIDQIQREGRKAGVAIIADTKGLWLAEFGNHYALRAGLLAHSNLALMRSGRNLALPLGLRQDHPQMPERWHTGQSTTGVGYTLRRDALFRSYWTQPVG